MHLQDVTPHHLFMGSETSILEKLKNSVDLQPTAELFYQDSMSEDDIGNAGIHFFQLLHSPTCTLQQIRKHK